MPISYITNELQSFLAAFALALAGIVGVFFKPTADEIRDGGQKWACIYVGIGVGCWIFGMLQVSN